MNNKVIQLSGMVPNQGMQYGRIVPNPFATAFMTEEEVINFNMNLGEIAMRILENERKAQDEKKQASDPTLKAINADNTTPVKDETEKSDLPKTKEKKDIKPAGASKVTAKEPKFTKLTNLIPADVKRDKNEVPDVKDSKFDDSHETWQEWDGKKDKRHIREQYCVYCNKSYGATVNECASCGKPTHDKNEIFGNQELKELSPGTYDSAIKKRNAQQQAAIKLAMHNPPLPNSDAFGKQADALHKKMKNTINHSVDREGRIQRAALKSKLPQSGRMTTDKFEACHRPMCNEPQDANGRCTAHQIAVPKSWKDNPPKRDRISFDDTRLGQSRAKVGEDASVNRLSSMAPKKVRKSNPVDNHVLKISRDTLKMHPAMRGVMGGPDLQTSKGNIKRITGKLSRKDQMADAKKPSKSQFQQQTHEPGDVVYVSGRGTGWVTDKGEDGSYGIHGKQSIPGKGSERDMGRFTPVNPKRK